MALTLQPAPYRVPVTGSNGLVSSEWLQWLQQLRTLLVTASSTTDLTAVGLALATLESEVAALTPLLVETNGAANGSQTLLNLIAGSGISLNENGAGSVTIASEEGTAAVTHATGPLTLGQLLIGNGGSDIKPGNLSGDVTTSGSTTATLAASGVTAGSYTNTSLTVDAKGRVTAASNGSAAAQPFLLCAYLPGQPAASFQFAFLIPSNLTTVAYPANMSGSIGKVDANPAATSTWTIKDNGTAIGTLAFSTSGTVTWTSTSGLAGTVAAGHEITVVGPGTLDATLQGVRFTLAWTR